MPILARAAGVVLAVFLTSTPSALAEDLAAPSPPVPEGSTDVPYPPGAAGDATVVLELVVETDGSVSRATVLEGSEPFAEHARTAVLGWRFVPARRGEVAVAARIRAQVVFRPEESASPVAARPPTSAVAPSMQAPSPVASDPPAPVAPEPVEIIVSGVRREVGQTTLSVEEVRSLPGAFGDAFRAIEILPGVTPIISGMPYFYVRGAPPNNNGYFVDGVRIPLLFHLGIGQGVIHQGLIERVDFFPSAAPARYGGFAGGIIVGQTREPASEFHGEANVRLIDAGALLEGPFAEGRGTALVAGRYGYPGPILNAVSPEIGLGYWDYQARTTWQLAAHDTVGLFAFGSHDYLATRSNAVASCQPSCTPSEERETEGEMVEQFVSDFHRLDLRYDHATRNGRLRLAATGGYDSQGSAPTYVTNHSAGLRFELDQQPSTTVRVRAGAEGRLDRYRLRLTESEPGEPTTPSNADPPPTNLYSAVHADVVLRLSRRVELVPGARAEVFASSRNREAPSTGRERTVVPAISPRLSARITLTRGLSWLSNLGLSHQYPSLRVGEIPAPFLTVPGFPFGVGRLQTAAQASSGFEVVLPAEITATATGFYTRFSGLTDLTAECVEDELVVAGPMQPRPEVAPPVCPNNQPVPGRAYGLEVLVRSPVSKRVSGWLSYTLSRSTREAHFAIRGGGEAVANVPSEFDRTHVFNASLGVDLGRGWRVGSRFLFYTGTPYSALDGSWPVPPYNAYRNPNFYRLDFRLEKRWRLGRSGSIAWVLEGQNVTLSKEVTGLGKDCKGPGSAEGTITCEYETIGPITIPSVGVEAYF